MVELNIGEREVDAHGAARSSFYYATLSDITERKAAEDALRTSEEKYRSLFENMTEEVHFWQLIRNEAGKIRTWRLMDINPAGLKGWGKTRSETVGKTADEIFPGATAHFMPFVWQFTVAGMPQTYETYFAPLDQHLRFTGVPMGEYFITTGADISDIKKASEILQESNADLKRRVDEQTAEIRRGLEAAQAERQRLFAVLEKLPVMICLLTSDHNIAFANCSFRDRFGQLHGHHCYDHCFGGKEPCSFCESYDVLETGRPHHWEAKAPDGSVIDTYDFPFTDTDGTKMVLEMAIDISDRRIAEEKLQEAQKNLEDRAAQLRALATELSLAEQRERKRLALVLHDGLQQMLVAAKFHVALFERGKNVAEDAGIIANLIDDCIETSRSLTAELSPPILHQGGLVPALEWLVQWMREKHGLSVELISQGNEKLPEAVSILLFQSIRELLFNAIKHAGTKEVRVGVRQICGQIQVEIADEGVGFDPEKSAGPGNHNGLGMGLFSIQERLGYLGGTMEIDAAPGRGARFTLIAPLTDKLEREPEYLSKTSVAFTTRPKLEKGDAAIIRVVLVDDHRVMRQGLASLLSAEPDMLVVGEASDGKAAIDLIHDTKPAVVLMDISMPGMDGIEATRQIHEQMPDVKVIGLSMFQEGEQAAAIIAAGAVKYLAKTGPSEAVIEAIRSCMHLADNAPSN